MSEEQDRKATGEIGDSELEKVAGGGNKYADDFEQVNRKLDALIKTTGETASKTPAPKLR